MRAFEASNDRPSSAAPDIGTRSEASLAFAFDSPASARYSLAAVFHHVRRNRERLLRKLAAGRSRFALTSITKNRPLRARRNFCRASRRGLQLPPRQLSAGILFESLPL